MHADIDTETGAAAGTVAEGGIPRDYRIASPPGWVRIVLDPETMDAKIAAIVAAQFRGTDSAPLVKQSLVRMLGEQCRTAAGNGGVEVHLSTLKVGEYPLSASMVVTLLAPRDGAPLPALDDLGVARRAAGEDVRMVEFPAGVALRRRYVEELAGDPGDGKGERRLLVTHVDFQFELPGSPLHLLLSYSTPILPLADAFAELFDTMTGTLRWIL